MAENNDLMERMHLDCGKVSTLITTFIREQVSSNQKNGVCLGMSGGIDSSVAITLAVQAMGDPALVHGLHLGDRDTQPKFTAFAEALGAQLGITFQKIDITPFIREQGIYKPGIMRIIPYSGWMNRFILWINNVGSRLFHGESPFVISLMRNDPENQKHGFLATMARHIEQSFNARHLQRRKMLEAYAEQHNLLLIGAANRSESFVGWFVKDGVDDLPIEVLLPLYKNQVRQLAQFLDVPEGILKEAPAPDMIKGLGDEDFIGHKYDIIDKVAYVMENHLNEDLLLREGIAQDDIDHVIRIHELSHWKRATPHQYPSLNSE